ncbi:hypothetical protein [Stackebrandtia soli]|uniref:hypothetical protein n=1 Tax=Stackebrandtia soli TaxID=1892856 RepID=UPI0039E7812A
MPDRLRHWSPYLPMLVIAMVVAVSVVTMTRAASSEPAQISARTVTVLQWNICGNRAKCPSSEDSDALIEAIRAHVTNPDTPADAALLQEVCRSFAGKLKRELEKHTRTAWEVRFAPIKLKRTADPDTAPDKKCARDRGDYGIAMALPAENAWWEVRYLPSPEDGEWRVAMCATIPSWWVKLCNTHFTSPREDDGDTYRSRQVAAYADFVWPSKYRVIFGGDLNLETPAVNDYDGGGVAPLYDAFVECSQRDAESARAGEGTYYRNGPYDDSDMSKVDYLFTQGDLDHRCGRPREPVEQSDHRPIWISVDLPAIG